jgi:zinc transport system substrate-binding protein
MKVVVSIAPLKGLIEPLLPPGSTVTVLIPPNTSEHGYELPPAQQQEAIKADLLVWIGMEEKIDAVSKENQRATRVDVRLADALGIEVHDDDHDHDHGKGEAEGGKPGGGAHEHEHGGEGDPHVWLDPQQAKLIVRAVAKKVAAARPAAGGEGGAGPDEVTAAVDAMCTRLDGLDKEYRDGLAGATTRTIVVGHDAFGWLARRYDLKTVAISGLTAAEPTPGDLQRAREAVKTNGLKAVFKEPQLDPAAAKSIAEATGAQVLTLDPLGDGDYFLMMRTNLKAIRTALGLEK